MFRIYDGRKQFYQWDLERKLVVEDRTINKVYFCNRLNNCSIVRCVYEVEGLRLVDVPNVILQNSLDVNVYGYDKNYTKHSKKYNVVSRSKPEDYVYTDEEVKVWDEFEERLVALEETIITEEDLIKYPTKTEMEAAIDAIPQPDMSGYYTKTEVDNKGYLTAHQDLSAYAKKTDLPNTSSFITMTQVESKGYQTEAQVTGLINAALGVIENGTY